MQRGSYKFSEKRKEIEKTLRERRTDFCAPVDRGLLRPAIAGESTEQGHRGRILGKRCFLHLAGGHPFGLYPKEPFANTIRALQIARSRLPKS